MKVLSTKQIFSAIMLWLVFFGVAPLVHALSFPPPPETKQNIYYVDQAQLIQPEAGAQINQMAAKLWQAEQIPMVVATIESLLDQDAEAFTVDRYAQALFDQWDIGEEKSSYGMLLLVARDDRKAYIHLGSAWGHRYDLERKQIMDGIIIPAFKRGNFSGGIAAGVAGMDSMVRNLPIPDKSRARWVLPLFIVVVVLLVAMIISMLNSGRKGWAWLTLAFIGLLIWSIVESAARWGSRTAQHSGDFFGGDSSDGGSGGSSGSW
jgi:uncharacterized protein